MQVEPTMMQSVCEISLLAIKPSNREYNMFCSAKIENIFHTTSEIAIHCDNCLRVSCPNSDIRKHSQTAL
jgi:hypothetical protein